MARHVAFPWRIPQRAHHQTTLTTTTAKEFALLIWPQSTQNIANARDCHYTHTIYISMRENRGSNRLPICLRGLYVVARRSELAVVARALHLPFFVYSYWFNDRGWSQLKWNEIELILRRSILRVEWAENFEREGKVDIQLSGFEGGSLL